MWLVVPVLAAVSLWPGYYAAHAQETTSDEAAASPFSISAEFKLVSDYRDRGYSYSTGSPAAQMMIIAAHRSGFYAGAFASSTGDDEYLGAVELDVLAGWAGQIAPGVTADVMLLYYFYPDSNQALMPKSDSWETAFHVRGDFGFVHPTIGVWYAWKQEELGDLDNLYIFSDLIFPVGKTPFEVKLHAGYTDGAYTLGPDRKVVDWGAGLSFNAGSGLTFALNYSGMDGPSVKDLTDDTIVLSVSLAL